MIPHFPRTTRHANGRVNRGGWRRSFRAVLNYLLDERVHAGEDVRVVHGNMAGTTAKDLAREFGISRALRPDIERPVWHVALSPAPEDAQAWSDPERRKAVVDAFVRRTITKEWEARREAALARGHSEPVQPDPDAYQWCGIEHRKPGEHGRPPHVHIVLSRIGLDDQLWYANRDAYHAAEVCRELEAEHHLRPLQRGGSHAAWKHPAAVRAVDGTDQALISKKETSLKAEAAARTRVAIAAFTSTAARATKGVRTRGLPGSTLSQSDTFREAESVLQVELLARGVQLTRLVNTLDAINGYRLTLLDAAGQPMCFPDGREASWPGSRLGFKKGRTIEATLEQWIALRTRPREPNDRSVGERT